MEVTCEKCGVKIEVSIPSFEPFRWATNEFHLVRQICDEVKKGRGLIPDKDGVDCRFLEDAVRKSASGLP